MMGNLDHSSMGLKRIRCETFMGLVFINCDEDAGDIVSALRL